MILQQWRARIIVFIERNRSRERKFKDEAADIASRENAIRHKD